MRVYRYEGDSLELDPEIARGGEGRVYAIEGDPKQVAKIYHRPTEKKGDKLCAMINNRPQTDEERHITIAWPNELIFDKFGNIIGFTMPYIDPTISFPLLKIYNPQDRLKTQPYFTWEYLVCMAKNLSDVVVELHRSGYVIGDLNESNVLVTSEAKVTLVDCDSIQVPYPASGKWTLPWTRQYFPCTVGKPEYTPPELQGKNFSEVTRRKYHDNFSLAVLIFLMLMEGRHPFSGKWKDDSEPPTLAKSIRHGYFPYVNSRKVAPPPYAVPFTTLPPAVQDPMIDCFRSWPWLAWSRPSAKDWKRVLQYTQNHLTKCEVNSQHVYSNHLTTCPWCERTNQGIPDPFPPVTGVLRPVHMKKQQPKEKHRHPTHRRVIYGGVALLVLLLVAIAIMIHSLFVQWVIPHLHQIYFALFWIVALIVLACGITLSIIPGPSKNPPPNQRRQRDRR